MSCQLTFWGTRGSIPTPGPATTRYGGNTPCVTLSAGGPLLILDAGSGLRCLGHELMRPPAPKPLRANLLLSHTHWDHIQGLPFFKPLSVRGNSLCVYGASQDGVALEEILGRQMDPMVFPVPLKAMAATVHVENIGEGELPLDGFEVTAFRLRHPGTTLGYRVAPPDGGRDLAYVTDNELGAGGQYDLPADWRDGLVSQLEGVDTLVHDAMYSDSMIEARAGWGHSTPAQAVDLAAECECRRLVLFHHEPEHDDAAVDRMLEEARAYARKAAPRLTVVAAVEGETLTL
ncbi:MAG TPA: MBL fold metallo-hydrolase [Gemmatimonadales bacterium]|nr:MBL fold metallo-hydrolase [Gemmatimonadales bacterium]